MREIYEGIDLDLNTYATEQGGELLTVIGEGFTDGYALYAIDTFTRRIQKSEGLAFKIARNVKGTHVTELALAKYYEQLRSWIDALFQYSPNSYFRAPNPFYQAYPVFQLSPEVGAFFESCRELDLLQETLRRPRDSYAPGVTYAELFNSLISRIREKTRSADYRKKVKAREHNAKRNFKSYSVYFNAMLNRWSRLLVLRVDLYFSYSTTEHISVGQAHEARRRFLNNMRQDPLFADLRGLIWKLEYARNRGHHFHFIFFYDGRDRQREEWIADEIGMAWRRLTGGSFHSCNRDPNKYKRRGIGMVNHYEVLKRECFLKDVLGYLTKQDQYLLVKPNKGRTIGRMEMPRARTSTAGRPRKRAA